MSADDAPGDKKPDVQNIHTDGITGGIVGVGGQQTFEGNVNINQTIIKSPLVRACPTPPTEPDHFGGRDVALAEITEKLKRGQTSVITAVHGLGGIGKTTLAKKAANVLYRDKTFHAVLWADVTRNPDPLRLLLGWGNLAGTLLPGDQPLAQIALQVKAMLEGVIGEKCEACDPSRVLVVLDDVWDDKDGKGKAAARILREAAPIGSTVLITTRSENLAVDLGAVPQSLDRLRGEDGVKMLLTYLPDADHAVLLGLTGALGGHPLAMKLAAQRVQKIPAHKRAATLSEHLAAYQTKLPAGTEFTDLDLGTSREDNLTLVLSFSYGDLSDDDKGRFRALGVLAHDEPFDLPMLAAIWEVEPREAEIHANTLRLLSLMDVDLETVKTYGGDWYTLHPLLHTYALALLRRDQAEFDALFARYADHVIEIAAQFQTLPPQDWGPLTPYLPHVHLVGDTLVMQSNIPDTDDNLLNRASYFANNITQYLVRRREVHRIVWLEMGLTISRKQGHRRPEALFLNELGLVYSALGEQRRALDFYHQALQISQVVGERSGEATTLNNIGGVYSDLGEQRRALDFYQRALPILQAVGNRSVEAAALNNIGGVYSDLGEQRRALDFYQQALPILQSVGDRSGEAMTLNNIGMVYRKLGENQKALDFFKQVLPISHVVGNRNVEAITLNNIGGVYSALGEKRRALDFYERALPILQAVGNRSVEATTLNDIGAIYNALGEQQRALDLLKQALAVSQAVGNLSEEATTLNNIGMVYRNLGENQKALDFFKQILPILQAVSNRSFEATTLNNIGTVYNALGEKRRALDFYEQALPILQTVGNRSEEASTLNNIGTVYNALGEKRRALDCFEQAFSILQTVGDRSGEASTLNNIGMVYSALGEKPRAQDLLKQALPILHSVGNRRVEAVTCFNIGMVYRDLGDLDKAIEYVTRCIELKEAVEDPGVEKNRTTLAQLREEKAAQEQRHKPQDPSG